MDGECRIAEIRPCPTTGSGWEDEEILKLIQSAPELLQALKRVIAMHDDQMFVSGVDDCGIIQTNLKSARAAIASAEGRVV